MESQLLSLAGLLQLQKHLLELFSPHLVQPLLQKCVLGRRVGLLPRSEVVARCGSWVASEQMHMEN